MKLRLMSGASAVVFGLASALTFISAAAATGATAQTAETTAKADDGSIQEVVVTAERRKSTAQKTAIAITVFDKATLERNNVQSIQDISKLAPGITLGQNSANVLIAVRGVSSRDTNEIGDPAVAISSDGFALQRPTGLADSIYDLERVEVLRGPQGTLYGRSATGGAINFITAKPTNFYEGKLGVGIGDYNLFTTEGMVNLPLTDTLSARASFSTVRHDGYRTNEGPANAGDDADSTSVRLHLLYKPTDRFNILLTGQFTHVGGVGPTLWGQSFTGASNLNFVPDLDYRGTSHSLPNQWIDTTTKTFQINAEYRFDFATLIYSGGYRDMNYRQLRDLDGTTTQTEYYLPDENPRDMSHELRLVSNSTGPFKWQLGANYYEEKNAIYTRYLSYAVANAPLQRFLFDYDVVAKSKALFGQVSYQVIDGLTFEVGARYSEDDKVRTGFQNLGAGDVDQSGASASHKITSHVGANWQVTPSNLLYAKYDTGYKAGGFTTILGVGIFQYAPETITAYEIGSKNRLFGNKVQLNLSSFLYDYTNQQATVSTGTTSYVVNAGASRLYGGEIEFTARPTSVDSIDAYVTYLHSEYLDFCVARTTAGVCTLNRAGNTLVQAPEIQFGAGYEHVFKALNGTITPRIQTHYETKSYLGVENFLRQRQGAFVKSDIMITYHNANETWSLQAYVKNLENTTVITTANANFTSYNYGMAAPRTMGVKLITNW